MNFKFTKTDHPLPCISIRFYLQCIQSMAKAFYKRHGVTEIEKAFELQWDPGKSRVMTTKYCVKYELGKCAKYQRAYHGRKSSGTINIKTWRKCLQT
jgi:hypothetical protein